MLLRSYLALKACAANRIELPGDVERLIESVYGEPADFSHDDPSWAAAIKEANKQLRAELSEDQKAASQFLITEPSDDDDILDRFSQRVEEDNPDAPKSRQAFTRLAEPTLRLVVVYDIGGKLWLDDKATVPAPVHRQPTLKDAEGFLGNTVTINHKGCVFHYRGVQPPDQWQRCGLLRFHRLVAVDCLGRGTAGHYSLVASEEIGIMLAAMERRKEENLDKKADLA